MNKIIKYGIIGIVIIIIILFGLNILFSGENIEDGSIINKLIGSDEDNISNISKNNNTQYRYGNSEIIYIKSKANIDSFISQINNESDLEKIDINNLPNNSTAYKARDGMYAILIIKSDNTEAVFIKSPNQEEMIKTANQITAGGKFLGQVSYELNNFKLNTDKINTDITITNIL